MATFEATIRSSSIAAAGTYNVIFTTGPVGATFTNRTVGFNGTAGSAIVYEAPTGVTGGSAVVPYKLDLKRTEEAAGVMTAGATISGTGTQSSSVSYYRGTQGNGQFVVGTYATTVGMRTLKPNTTYLLQFTNSDGGAQVIDLYFQWKEGK